MRAVRNQKDFWAGLIFLLIGVAFAAVARDYDFGVPRRMGPGFFPMILAIILALIGGATMIRSFVVPGDPVQRFALKGLFLITIGTLLFGILVRDGGMIAAVAAITLVTASASVKFRWQTALMMAFVLAAFCSAVFVYGLGLPIPVIGRWFGG